MAIINTVNEGKYGCNKLRESHCEIYIKCNPRVKRDTEAGKNI